MPKFEITAYRMERYCAEHLIEADTPEQAVEKAKQMDSDGTLDFSDYAGDSDNADAFLVDDEDGERLHEDWTQAWRMSCHKDELLERAAAVCDLWATNQLAEAVRLLQETVNNIQGE